MLVCIFGFRVQGYPGSVCVQRASAAGRRTSVGRAAAYFSGSPGFVHGLGGHQELGV